MFKLQIETNNAAFGETDCETFQEIGYILRRLRLRLTTAAAANCGYCRAEQWIEPIRDLNGNIIGSFTYQRESEE